MIPCGRLGADCAGGDVPQSPRFRRWFSVEVAQLLVAEMWRAGLQFDDPVRSEPLGPDPDDDYLLALAGAASAVLVTGDRALIEHTGVVTVLSPAAFLATQAPEGK